PPPPPGPTAEGGPDRLCRPPGKDPPPSPPGVQRHFVVHLGKLVGPIDPCKRVPHAQNYVPRLAMHFSVTRKCRLPPPRQTPPVEHRLPTLPLKRRRRLRRTRRQGDIHLRTCRGRRRRRLRSPG